MIRDLKNSLVSIVMIVLAFLPLLGCGGRGIEGPSYDFAHLFGQCCDGSDLVRVDIGCRNDSGYNPTIYDDLDEKLERMTLTRGGSSKEYGLKFSKTRKRDGSILDEYIITDAVDDSPVGTLDVTKDSLCVRIGTGMQLAFCPVIVLDSSAQTVAQVSQSSDGVVQSFLIVSETGGSGSEAWSQSNIVQYRSAGVNHFIYDFDEWNSHLMKGNFLHLYDVEIADWKDGNRTIYLFNNKYFDSHPMSFPGGADQATFSTIGAFRIVDGSLVPAEIFKTRNGTLNSIVVACASEEAPGFKVDKAKGVLGVPLIETDDYLFHGKYLVYDWNPDTGMFEYNGKKQPLP